MNSAQSPHPSAVAYGEGRHRREIDQCAPPNSWWICDPRDFAALRQREQRRMEFSRYGKQILTTASNTQEDAVTRMKRLAKLRDGYSL